ncbi:UDP-N-acetylglucosamine 2-epimerase [Alphaproteobacteria bacterium]|nr:UDP-N-acetylglucosamine 2-epimerase [Alphaproteobacteria bacterium]
MSQAKKIIIVTATRADYGKLKTVIKLLEDSKEFKTYIFATGMHNLHEYGYTYNELIKDKIKNIYVYKNQKSNEPMDSIISNTIIGFSKYLKEIKPDLVIIHGDRSESLACSISCLNNGILCAHVEGGEVSGTLDEMYRHSISKLATHHFVSNEIAEKRLLQMGEDKDRIFNVGAPNVDIILRKDRPTLEELKKRYDYIFNEYAVLIFHSVVTELDTLKKNVNNLINAIKKSKMNYVVIFPNNDQGSLIIKDKLKNELCGNNFRLIPSMRFEYYLTLLENANFIIGNSSSGIMEAPYFGVPTINIGTRQKNRATLPSIKNINYSETTILKTIRQFIIKKRYDRIEFFGINYSANNIKKTLLNKKFWKIKSQKYFNDLI